MSVNSASFEQLRELGFSVTQTGRVLAYRERSNGFRSIDEVASIPGIAPEFLAGMRGRLTL